MEVVEEEGNSHLIPWAMEGAVAVSVVSLAVAAVSTIVAYIVLSFVLPITMPILSPFLICAHQLPTEVSFGHVGIVVVVVTTAVVVIVVAAKVRSV